MAPTEVVLETMAVASTTTRDEVAECQTQLLLY